jgi:hypothetical protein
MKCVRHVAYIREINNAYNIFVWNWKESYYLGKHQFRLENSKELGPKKIKWEGVDWIHLA